MMSFEKSKVIAAATLLMGLGLNACTAGAQGEQDVSPKKSTKEIGTENNTQSDQGLSGAAASSLETALSNGGKVMIAVGWQSGSLTGYFKPAIAIDGSVHCDQPPSATMHSIEGPSLMSVAISGRQGNAEDSLGPVEVQCTDIRGASPSNGLQLDVWLGNVNADGEYLDSGAGAVVMFVTDDGPMCGNYFIDNGTVDSLERGRWPADADGDCVSDVALDPLKQ